jgi:hypothetical protein
VVSFTETVSDGAWHRIASTFVRCTDDRAVAINHQDLMAARCTHVTTIESDHSPFASAVKATADVLEPLARGEV